MNSNLSCPETERIKKRAMITTDRLPKGFTMRVPTLDDAEAAYEVVHACDMADDGMPDHTLEEFRLAWQEPDFNLATDAWCVFAPTGQLVGVADTEHSEHVRVYAMVRVHPDFRQQGIEEYLLGLTEARARQHIALAAAEARVTLNNWMSHNDNALVNVLKRTGYTFSRSYWRMQIDLEKAPATPQWPEGMTVRTLAVGKEERAVFEMIEEAFQDHWGHMPHSFEQWKHWHFNASFDPSLWFLAFEGDTLAGGILCRYDEDLEMGWVGQLAVLRPWRRKGLGMALLLHAFGELYRRGNHTIGLGVDSQNLTGATRLYERAGMHIAIQHDTYQKELRAGVERSTQSITV